MSGIAQDIGFMIGLGMVSAGAYLQFGLNYALIGCGGLILLFSVVGELRKGQ